MKLLMIIAGDEYEEEITSKLVENKFMATNIGSSGDFLQYGYVVLMLGVKDDEVVSVYRTLGLEESMDLEHLPYHGEVSIHMIQVNDYLQMKKAN